MSLTETSLFEAVRIQYLYKLKSRLGMFLAMAGVQVMALLFSFGGVMSFGMGSPYVSLSVKYFSSEMVIGSTFLWIFVAAVLITKKDYQNIDFTFVSNRLSSNLSNAAFLVTAALVGGVTAMLSGFLLRIIVYFNGSCYLLSRNFMVTPEVIFTGIAVTILYLLLLGSLGYFCGILMRHVELPEHAFLNIVAERKNRADGKIEAVSYATKTIVELIDFSFPEAMKPHRVTLEGNVLKVDAPEHLKLEVGTFSREFVVSQILGEPAMSNHHSMSTTGSQLLYLRIPADVEVQSKGPITFVE